LSHDLSYLLCCSSLSDVLDALLAVECRWPPAITDALMSHTAPEAHIGTQKPLLGGAHRAPTAVGGITGANEVVAESDQLLRGVGSTVGVGALGERGLVALRAT